LELPEAAREWVHLLMRVLLKYRALVRPGELATELVALSRSIREFHSLLRNPEAARFITVARAAELPRLETERLLRRLTAMRLASPAIVVNALTPPTARCPRCRAIRAGERAELDALRRRGGRRPRRCAIIEAPLLAPPPNGSAALEAWAAHWSA
jgi:anion-transporting  ArsA/GET3 family ATPase